MTKFRCSGTMTEAQYLAFIRSALRARWLRWQPRSAALMLARKPYSGPNKRQQWVYQCAICTGLFSAKDVEVDHYPLDAGSILKVEDVGAFCGRLFCETDNLRVVCKGCHSIHTYACKEGVSFEEAKRLKEIIEFLKSPKEVVLQFLSQHGYSGDAVSNADKRRKIVELIYKEKVDG